MYNLTAVLKQNFLLDLTWTIQWFPRIGLGSNHYVAKIIVLYCVGYLYTVFDSSLFSNQTKQSELNSNIIIINSFNGKMMFLILIFFGGFPMSQKPYIDCLYGLCLNVQCVLDLNRADVTGYVYATTKPVPY